MLIKKSLEQAEDMGEIADRRKSILAKYAADYNQEIKAKDDDDLNDRMLDSPK